MGFGTGAGCGGGDPQGSGVEMYRLDDARWYLMGETSTEHIIAPTGAWVEVRR